MSTPYGGTPPLTDEQQAVVDLPTQAMALVVAGAGSGKTHTLVRRLDALVEREGLGAGGILVLGFSRAAVRELKERLVRHGETARHVQVRTFDSWALEVLVEVDADGGWQARDFDPRIVAAADLMGDPAVNDMYEDLRHVVIDEVQDLVGTRRELVEALLDTYDCGFTVVGDPAQSIYGFQVRDAKERAGETNRFFDWLRARFGEELTELRLSRNFRALTTEAEAALPLGPALQAGAEEHERGRTELYDELRMALLDAFPLGKLDDRFVCDGLRDHDGTTAVLCHTNGNALLVSELLHRGDVPHRVQRAARDRALPTWIALLYRRATSTIVTRAEFEELAPDLGLPENSADSSWRSLLRAVPGRSTAVDLTRLRTIIAERRMPDELTAQPPARLVVSSIHRAKGLEFDRVIVLDPGPLREQTEDPDEMARMLYVALTRPRHELMRLDELKTYPMYIRKQSSPDRWGRFQIRRRGARLGIEMTAQDVETDRPSGSHLTLPAGSFDLTAVELQDHFANAVDPGDEVVLERLEKDSPYERQAPRYLVLHGGSGVPVGLTSERLAIDLYSHMQWPGKRERRWPAAIRGVWIDAVETVAGSRSAGDLAGLGERGVWLAPRLVGLSRFSYDQNADAEEDDHGETR